jgi:carbamoyl-phosphate synthase small subunit
VYLTKDYKKSYLMLSNGDVFAGKSPLWQQDNIHGELVFNTGMAGYEETLTDPSYAGQILTFTFPILGNYGVSNNTNWESAKIFTQGIICQNIFNDNIHYLSQQSFLDWLKIENIPIIYDIDTRNLTKIIRNYGVLNAMISYDPTIKYCADNQTAISLIDVSVKVPEYYGDGKYKIILVDCGCKKNIIRNLLKFDFNIKLVPFDYDYSQEDYAGIFLSNGPGDPKQATDTIQILTKVLQENKPIYGICLGSQLMALASGFDTYKLKFGHRGQNQPCINLLNNLCYLTSQNHGYAIDETTLNDEWVVSFRNINDDSVAGIKHKYKPFASVQFHPEASPGPQDTFYFFEEFYQQILNSN